MDPLTALALGVLQGVAEWLPVSSEAVTTLFMTRVLGTAPATAVSTAIWLHTGTMLAATVYFRDEIRAVLTTPLPTEVSDPDTFSRDQRVLAFLIVATIVTAIVGGVLYIVGVQAAASRPDLFAGLMAGALFLTGLLQLRGTGAGRSLDVADRADAFLTGALQGLAVVPGISRSGVTVFGLLARDMDAEDAFTLSFLMSIPAVLVANVGLELLGGVALSPAHFLAAGTAFVVSLATIDAVLRIARHTAVAWICFALALISALPLVL